MKTKEDNNGIEIHRRRYQQALMCISNNGITHIIDRTYYDIKMLKGMGKVKFYHLMQEMIKHDMSFKNGKAKNFIF